MFSTRALRGSWTLILSFTVIAAFCAVVVYVFPGVPSEATIATAFRGTGFHYFGEVYRDALQTRTFTLKVRETAGAVENLKLLRDPKSGVQAGFVLGGVSSGERPDGLYSLGTLYHVGLWIFYVAPQPAEALTDFKGRRIALGPRGSGIRLTGEKIFATAGITDETASFSDLGGDAAFEALRTNAVDAVWTTAPADAPIVRHVLEIPNVRIFAFKNADAYTRLHPELTKIELPRGVLDLARDRPDKNMTILATRVRVLVREDIHPEVVHAMLTMMSQVHGKPGVAQKAGEFPIPVDPEYSMLPTAIEFYKNGPSFFHRHAPLWLVPQLQRITLLIAAIVPIVFLVISGEPQVYRWIIRERVRPLYRRMRTIEGAILSASSREEVQSLQRELEDIDKRAGRVRIPNRYADSLFSLKVHINLVRLRLLARFNELRS